MVSLDWQLDRTGEVTLVELTVRSEFDQRVRIESELTPVWPPRQHGTPLEGWDDTVFEGDVGPDNPLVLGYATPAEPTDPPATIAATAPPPDDETLTPREIVQTLGEGSPPRDTLATRPRRKNAGTDGTASRTPTDSADIHFGSPAHSDSPGRDGRSTGESAADAGSVTPVESHTPQQPTAWLDAVESRLSTVETLARTNDADEARKAVTALGGIEDVRALQAQLDADRRHLEELQSRSTALTEQLSAVELPLATLERIV
jgi:hypothetical protein